MPKRLTSRLLQVFVLHARQNNELINYGEVIRDIAAIPPEKRFVRTGNRVLAIPHMRVEEPFLYLMAYYGQVGLNPLIFNTGSAKERLESLEKGEIVATRTHAILNWETRECIIEYNLRGAKYSNIAFALEALGTQHTDYEHISVELNPLADKSFFSEIDRFERVTVARMQVVRPNVDWSDSANMLATIADESHGRTAEIRISAGRDNSLSKQSGIVAIIKELAGKAHSMLKNATIEGRRIGEDAPTRISLNRFIEHQRVRVPIVEGHADSVQIEKQLFDYARSRAEDVRFPAEAR